MSKISILNEINTITDQEDIWMLDVANFIFLVPFHKCIRIGLTKSKIFLETTKWKILKAEVIYTMAI